MLNKSCLHLNENDTKWLVNNFYFGMTKWYETICLDRLATSTKDFLKRKAVNKNLCSESSTVNTNGPIITYSRNSNNEKNKEKSLLSINECSNAFESVKSHKLQNPKNVVIGHLNVNSLRNKIAVVEELMRNKIDIGLFSETKLDESFPNQQFKIHGCKMHHRDRNKHGDGVLCYVDENIPCKMIKCGRSSRWLGNNFDWIFHQNSKMALPWPL